MRILILHASLGSGHVSAAAAVAAALEQRGVETRSVDALEYTHGAMRSLVRTIITKFSQESPALYRALYEGTDSPDPEAAMAQNELYGRLQAPLYDALAELIEEYRPDAIISAQQLPALVVHALDASGRIDIPHFIVITDYMAHSSWILSGIDGYYVAWDGVKEVLVSWGIDASTVTVSGIPVRLDLTEPKDQHEARERRGLALDGPVVLAIASGIAPARFVFAVEQLAAAMRRGDLVVVAGRNGEVLEALETLEAPENVRLQVEGFVDYLDDLVAASDVVLTKTGGLITTEVLVRGVPLVAFDPFPGQEEWNADCVSGAGAGVQVRVPGMVAPVVAALLEDADRRATMTAAAAAVAKPNAAHTVAGDILARINQSA